MSNVVTPKVRESIYTAISNGWSDQRILNRFGISTGSLAAYKAHVTMGTWKPAKSAARPSRPSARRSARRSNRTTATRMQLSVPRKNLSVSFKGDTAFVSVTLP